MSGIQWYHLPFLCAGIVVIGAGTLALGAIIGHTFGKAVAWAIVRMTGDE